MAAFPRARVAAWCTRLPAWLDAFAVSAISDARLLAGKAYDAACKVTLVTARLQRFLTICFAREVHAPAETLTARASTIMTAL